MPFDSHFGPPAWFFIIFFGIVGLVAYSILSVIYKGMRQWNSDNTAPPQSLEATVITKRASVSGRERHTSTAWHVTFEFASGGRHEFEVKGHEFGLLAEGDAGRLDFQGTRYLGFMRSGSAEAKESAPVVPPPDLSCAYCQSAIPAGQLKCASCGWTYRPETTSHES